jgi:hypothetical protein
MFIVSDIPESIPNIKFMTSTGLPIQNGPVAIAQRLPTDKEMRIVSEMEAEQLFGRAAGIIDGVTVRLYSSTPYRTRLTLHSVAR